MVLEIVRAQREVSRAQRVLADCKVREHEKIVQLHRFKAQQSQNITDVKDLDIGNIIALFRTHGQLPPIPPLCRPTSYKVRRSHRNGEWTSHSNFVVEVHGLLLDIQSGILTHPVGGRLLAVQLD